MCLICMFSHTIWRTLASNKHLVTPLRLGEAENRRPTGGWFERAGGPLAEPNQLCSSSSAGTRSSGRALPISGLRNSGCGLSTGVEGHRGPRTEQIGAVTRNDGGGRVGVFTSESSSFAEVGLELGDGACWVRRGSMLEAVAATNSIFALWTRRAVP
jgi:hypothetical protein